MKQEVNDYELISLAQEHNEDALEILRNKYKPLLEKIGKKYYCVIKDEIDYEDVIQEIYLTFEEAIQKFNDKKNICFYTFATSCIKKHLLTLIKTFQRQKYITKKNQISLDYVIDNEEDNLLNYIQDNINNPERITEEKENEQNLYKQIIAPLTPLEECVITLKIQNFTYEEIASILDKDKKSINNTIQRIRKKLTKSIKNNI